MTVTKQGQNAIGLQQAVGCLTVLLLLPIAFLVKLLVWPFERPKRRTPQDVAGILRDYLDGTVSDSAWDDFICVPIADPWLEAIRERCLHLEREFPPEQRPSGEESFQHRSFVSAHGHEVVRGYIRELEAAAEQDVAADEAQS